MNILNNKEFILRCPLTIILLSIIILILITMFTWYGIYSPAIKISTQQGYELKKKVSEVDYKLKSQKYLFKKLSLAQFNISFASAISQTNDTTISLLNDLSELSNISKNHFSLTENSKNTITVTIQPKNVTKFHSLIETIESRKYIDRLTIVKNNKEYVLMLYVRHLQGDK